MHLFCTCKCVCVSCNFPNYFVGLVKLPMEWASVTTKCQFEFCQGDGCNVMLSWQTLHDMRSVECRLPHNSLCLQKFPLSFRISTGKKGSRITLQSKNKIVQLLPKIMQHSQVSYDYVWRQCQCVWVCICVFDKGHWVGWVDKTLWRMAEKTNTRRITT